MVPIKTNSLLRTLREERGLSQRLLAKRLGKSKSHVMRMENKREGEFTLEEIKGLAKAFEMTQDYLNSLFMGDDLQFSSLHEKGREINYGPGIKVKAHVFGNHLLFSGILSLGPQISMDKKSIPRSSMTYYLVLKGLLTVRQGTREYVLKESQYFCAGWSTSFEFYNPNQIMPVQLLIAATPPFQI
ncbi:MAG: helix-turn-helix domain-containing protein [Candidatus Omnitrophica bacterium]|nr:helix-turn-helix domain-containing protein [Candidatus Omnitrophota bacterium]